MIVQVVLWLAKRLSPTLISVFLTGFRYFSNQVATQLSSEGWMDPVPEPIAYFQKNILSIAGNRTRDLLDGSQVCKPPYQIGGHLCTIHTTFLFFQFLGFAANLATPLKRWLFGQEKLPFFHCT